MSRFRIYCFVNDNIALFTAVGNGTLLLMPKRIANFIVDFMRLESAAGILLFFTALLAIVVANTAPFDVSP